MILRRYGLAATVVAVLVGVLGASGGGAAPDTSAGGPSKAIPGQLIVQVRSGADPAVVGARHAQPHGGLVLAVYRHALHGFAIRVPPQRAERARAELRADPDVLLVEPDLVVEAAAQTLPTGVNRIEADKNPTAKIDGVDERVKTTIAVIDTGVDLSHPDLNVNKQLSYNCAWGGNTANDKNGHGSHVAGTAAALDNATGVVGVAPGAEIAPVRVLGPNGSGSMSCVIKGVDFVTANAAKIAVANMSLGAQGISTSLRTAIQSSVAKGVVYVVAAGNDGKDVYGPDGVFGTSDDFIPASYPEVATISALADSDGKPGGLGSATSYGSDDSFASFSNFSKSVVAGNPVSSPGAAIDLLLPGVSIYSTYKDGSYATLSGTSMATPHGAGLAALYIGAAGTRDATGDGVLNQDDVYEVRQALIDAGAAQSGANGLKKLNDPDGNLERIGWAGGSPPTADAKSVSTNEDAAVAIVLSGSDAETCELAFSIVSGPAHGTLGSIAGQPCVGAGPYSDSASATYTPAANYNGPDSFVYRVSDGDGLVAEATVSVTVSPVNDAPSAVNDSATTPIGTPVTIDVLANDGDVDGEALSVTNLTQPLNGTATLNADKTVTYTPNPSFSGPDSFTYTANDGTVDSNVATVSITVSGSPPTADAKSVSTNEDAAVAIVLSGSDAETCELAFSIVSGPAHGTLGSIAGQPCVGAGPYSDSASATYTPAANYNGPDSFVYRVSDGDGLVAEATVSVTVSPVNDAPSAVNDSATTPIGTPVTIDVLANDGDVDGDALTVTNLTQPLNGTATLNADKTVTYTPNPSFSGPDSFTYTANDGTVDSNVATVSITVQSAGYSENFEGDVSGWTATGLWHVANNTGCASPSVGYTSPIRSFYYGQESTCNYNTGGANTGTLTSPAISNVTNSVTLKFKYWRAVESYNGAYDKTNVQVSYNGGSTWTTVWSKDSRNASEKAWTNTSIALTPSSTTMRLRFVFDTVDGVANGYVGWLIDDVEVVNG
jgi:subtilisin family serine protease